MSKEGVSVHRRRKVRGANKIKCKARTKSSPHPFLRDLARPLTPSQCSQELLDERTTVSEVE